MNYLNAQKELVEAIVTASGKVDTYFWRLSGDQPNSLCRFLGMDEEELKVVLRLCKIYNGERDNFSKNNFDLLMSQCGYDWTTYRLNQKVERFSRIGDVVEIVLPKNMYDLEGNLLHYPIEDQHVRIIRTKSQHGALPKLVDVGNNKQASEAEERSNNKKKSSNNMSPNVLLLEYVAELVVATAGTTGHGKISMRSARKLHRMMLACVDVAAKELLHAALEKYASQKEVFADEEKQTASLVSPERQHSTNEAAIRTHGFAEAPVELEDDAGYLSDDERSIGSTTTTDEFLVELKEEVVLQSLLHKRIHDKKERVFQLEHRNGRRLLVVLPPDSMSTASFEEEAKKTQWVDIIMNTKDRVEGMLSYLAKTNSQMYVAVGKKRRLSMMTVALNTTQTLALARVGRLNDVRMQYIRSFLKHIGGVNLQLSKKEQVRIDRQVGLHRTTKDVVEFGSCLHEWLQTKGKERRSHHNKCILEQYALS
jgi:hypothetical protein